MGVRVGVDSSVCHVLLSPIDNLGQFVADEEQQTRDVRVAPYYWGESKRFGSGAMGLEVLVAIRLQVIQGLGHVIGEGVLPLELVFKKLDKDGYLRHVQKLKNAQGVESTLFLTMKGLSIQETTASLDGECVGSV